MEEFAARERKRWQTEPQTLSTQQAAERAAQNKLNRKEEFRKIETLSSG